MRFLGYFSDLFHYFSVLTGVTLVILLLYLLHFLSRKKIIIWYILSYILLISSFALVHLHVNNQTDATFFSSLIVAWLSYMAMLYFAWQLQAIRRSHVLWFALLLTVPTILKFFITGYPAWFMFLFQGAIMAILFIYTNIRIFNIRQRSLALVVFLVSTLVLFVSVALSTFQFDLHRPLLPFHSEGLLLTIHFLGIGYLVFQNEEWFPHLKKSQIYLILSGFSGFLTLTAWVYYLGIYHWSRFSLATVHSIFDRGMNHLSNTMVTHFPLNASLALLCFGVFVLLLLSGFVFRSYRKQITIQDLVNFNEKVFDTAANALVILQGDRIVRVNPGFYTLFGLQEGDLEVNQFSLLAGIEMPDWSRKKSHSLALRNARGETIHCSVYPSTFEDRGRTYTLLVLEHLDRIHRELADSVFYNNILQVLITDSSWPMRLKLLHQLIRGHLSPRELYLEITFSQKQESYGIIAEEHRTLCTDFLEHSQELFTIQRLAEEELWVFRLSKSRQNFGFAALLFDSVANPAGYQSLLSIVSYVLSQFLEEAYLYDRLSRSEMQYRGLVENSLTGIIICYNGEILFNNQKFLSLTGKEQSQVSSMHPSDLAMDISDRRNFSLTLLRVQEGKTRHAMQSFRSRGAQDQELWYSVYLSHIEYQSRQAVICHILDITPQVDATRQRQKLTELMIKDQKMNTLRNLVRGIAHEFNNVFAIIKGYTELLQVSLAEQARDSADLTTIMSAVRRGIEIANRMHVFIKQETIDIQRLPSPGFFQESLPGLEGIIRRSEKKISLRLDVQNSPTQFMADAFSLEHVLQNLIQNAIDAIDQEGVINLRILEKGDTMLSVLVEDNGQGIPQSSLRFVFDPFYTTKEGAQGADLGLYICHEMMDRMGGLIQIESREKEYTRVTLCLPLARSEYPPAQS